MQSLAVRGLLRRAVTRLHRWTGLVIMACMLVAAVTGVWLTFRVEMDRLVNPELRTVQAGAQLLPLASTVAAIEQRFPNASVHTLVLQDRPDDSISAYLDSKNSSPVELDRVIFNPYTGAFLGGSNTHDIVFARANVDSLVDRLHYSLWIRSFGLSLMGVVAGTWLVTSLIGFTLAWPSMWLRLKSWIPVLSARTDRGAYQANYQLHRAIGVWFLPVLILLAFTSFYQNMPQYVRPVVNLFSPLADFLIARKLPVYQFSEWTSVDALLKNFEILGQLVGEEQKAAAVLKADRATLATAAQKKWAKPVRAVYYSEGIVFAANTVPSQVLKLAGLTDVASEFGLSGYVKSSPTLLKNLNPDVVLFGEDNDEEQKKTAAMFKTAEYQAIAAIKAGKVYAIPGKHITTTSHLIVNAVTDAQKLVSDGMR